MRQLVLSMCGGYASETARCFLSSLRKTGSQAEVLLLLHGNPEETEEALRAQGAQTLPVQMTGVPESVSYNVARWSHFLECLAARPQVERVLVSDVRDVLFQRDPFAWLGDDAVHLFEEHPDKPIGACLWTSSWLRYRYGDAALPPVSTRPVLCSGVLAGKALRVRDFIARIVAELTPPLRATHYMAGYDQGVVNQLAYRGGFRDLVCHPWESSPVLHLGNAPKDAVRRDGSGAFLNTRGEVAAVVHQYDRHQTEESESVKES